MSIVRSLKLLFDPIEYRDQKLEEKRKAQTNASLADAAPPSAERQCRACGFRGATPICLSCLTPTMEPRS